jgi:uncharacterized membrane protein
MEAMAVILGFLVLIAFGLALIGVPMLFSKVKALKQQVSSLEQKVANGQLVSTKPESVESEAPSENIPSVERSKLEQAYASNSETDVEQVSPSVVESISLNIETKTEKVAESKKSGWNSTSTASKIDLNLSSSSSTAASNGSVELPGVNAKKSAWQPLIDKLLSMNITAQVGAVVLIFGAIFLGKYASDIGVLTLNAKLWFMGGVSIAITASGIVFYKRLHIYGEILQGTGFAGWLVTLFVTHVLYERLHWMLVLVLGVASVLTIGYRAWKQNSQVLAMVAFFGGFLTPFIASSEVSSLWRLFAYLSVLNLGVVLTATQKPWRWLVRESYVSSYGLLGLLMLAEYLQNDLNQLVIQLPMAAFGLITTIMLSVLAWRWLQTEQLQYTRHVSGLLFGVPAAAAIALQGLFSEASIYTAYGFVVLGVWYGVLWFISRRLQFLGIAIVLVSAAIPFALSDSLTSLVYSIEGAAFAYWAIKHNKRLTFLWGVGLQVLAAGFTFHLFQDVEVRTNELFISWILHGGIVAAGLVTAWQIKTHSQPFKPWATMIEKGVLAWSLLFWLYHWAFWLSEEFSKQYTLWWYLWVTLGTVVGLYGVTRKVDWPNIRLAIPALTALYVGCAILFLVDYAGDASILKLVLISFAAIGLLGMRWFMASREEKPANWDALISWFGLLGIASIALYSAPTIKTDWNLALAMLVPLAAGFYLRSLLVTFFKPHFTRTMTRWLSLGVLFVLTLATLPNLGNFAPLPFWPLLHPMLLLPLVAGEVFYRFVRRNVQLRIVLLFWLGLLITTELNRYLFHYAGVSFNVDSWLESALTQTVWSLVWATIGGLLMVTGARFAKSRTRWYTGALVLALIVVKLFLLDLAQVDTLFRIISFISVGGLLLGIGYFAPLPDNKSASPISEPTQ